MNSTVRVRTLRVRRGPARSLAAFVVPWWRGRGANLVGYSEIGNPDPEHFAVAIVRDPEREGIEFDLELELLGILGLDSTSSPSAHAVGSLDLGAGKLEIAPHAQQSERVVRGRLLFASARSPATVGRHDVDLRMRVHGQTLAVPLRIYIVLEDLVASLERPQCPGGPPAAGLLLDLGTRWADGASSAPEVRMRVASRIVNGLGGKFWYDGGAGNFSHTGRFDLDLWAWRLKGVGLFPGTCNCEDLVLLACLVCKALGASAYASEIRRKSSRAEVRFRSRTRGAGRSDTYQAEHEFNYHFVVASERDEEDALIYDPCFLIERGGEFEPMALGVPWESYRRSLVGEGEELHPSAYPNTSPLWCSAATLEAHGPGALLSKLISGAKPDWLPDSKWAEVTNFIRTARRASDTRELSVRLTKGDGVKHCRLSAMLDERESGISPVLQLVIQPRVDIGDPRLLVAAERPREARPWSTESQVGLAWSDPEDSGWVTELRITDAAPSYEAVLDDLYCQLCR